MEDAKLAELKKLHPRGALYVVGDNEFFLRPPSRGEFRRFQQLAVSDDGRPIAMENMALQSTIYPDQGALNSLLDEWPALTTKLFACALELAGGEKQVVKKG